MTPMLLYFILKKHRYKPTTPQHHPTPKGTLSPSTPRGDTPHGSRPCPGTPGVRSPLSSLPKPAGPNAPRATPAPARPSPRYLPAPGAGCSGGRRSWRCTAPAALSPQLLGAAILRAPAPGRHPGRRFRRRLRGARPRGREGSGEPTLLTPGCQKTAQIPAGVHNRLVSGAGY